MTTPRRHSKGRMAEIADGTLQAQVFLTFVFSAGLYADV
jgi:hypothetical protein